ncbi:MAG: class I SAM-dependent methyltransferase [Chloroflexi bacterium]|nr:class I SAM-dependent methyltransferase [Chloroflexota bacterium]
MSFLPYPGASDPSSYEELLAASDPDGLIERCIYRLVPPHGSTLLDIGAGSGYHALRYAQRAARVYALEPDPRMLAQLYRRLAALPTPNLSVLAAGAEDIPLRDASIDLAIARFAYFLGTPACLPGLAEVRRVLAPGSSLCVVDYDPSRGDIGALARAVYPALFGPDYRAEHDIFYRAQGFSAHPLDTVLRLPSRASAGRLLRLDFPHISAAQLAALPGLELSCCLLVYHLKKSIKTA